MPTTSEDQKQIADALTRLAVAMEQLQTHYDATQRANRRVRVALFVATLIILGGTVSLTISEADNLLARVLPPKLAFTDPEAAAAKRKQMLDALPAEERANIDQFEKRLDWVGRYLDVSPDFNAGAAVAHFLADMSRSVAVMPDMDAQVRSMKFEMRAISDEMRSMNAKMNSLPAIASDVQGLNGKMDALPILATEVQGMHVQMSIMAGGVDSTMGRAGRMMPWNW